MSMNDLISDLAARIRNGQQARLATVTAPAAKLSEGLLKVLEAEGYIAGFAKNEVRKGVHELQVTLKYHEGEPVISAINRVSKPGRRVYVPIDELKRVGNGLGISVLSTSRGVMSDSDARAQKVGGEVLCTVF